jgi:hypothetical protein
METITASIIQNTKIEQTFTVPNSLKLLQGSEIPSNSGVLRIMTPKDGDKRVVWNRDSLAEISDAKKMFDDLSSSGLTPFKVGVGGKATAEIMDEFDPFAEEIIFMPRKMLAGG